MWRSGSGVPWQVSQMAHFFFLGWCWQRSAGWPSVHKWQIKTFETPKSTLPASGLFSCHSMSRSQKRELFLNASWELCSSLTVIMLHLPKLKCSPFSALWQEKRKRWHKGKCESKELKLNSFQLMVKGIVESFWNSTSLLWMTNNGFLKYNSCHRV